jgi:hypothetical protein
MSLQTELNEFCSVFFTKAPAEVGDACPRTDLKLAASGVTQHALKAGDRAPDFIFIFRDALGGTVRLSTSLAKGPIVLTFCRGCGRPYRVTSSISKN